MERMEIGVGDGINERSRRRGLPRHDGGIVKLVGTGKS